MKISQQIGNDGGALENTWIEYDDEFSGKDFSNQFLTDKNLDGQTIYSSLFYHEIPDTNPFRPQMSGVTFINCDLSNLIIPEGNTLINCTQIRFKAQKDLNDWIIDENNLPLTPPDPEFYIEMNYPMPDPEDIPKFKVDFPINLKKVAQELYELTI